MKRFYALVLPFLLILGACSDDTPTEPTGCVEGATRACACIDGSMGAQSCNAQGTFDACTCASENNNVVTGDAGIEPDSGPVDSGGNNNPFLNECGGSDVLPEAPGNACGPCNDGVIACEGPDTTQCIFARELNACGGCQDLPGVPEDPCGCGDGQWTCNPDGTLGCNASPANSCGGCSPLSGEFRDACDNGAGFLSCSSEDELICVPVGANPCGGSDPLAGFPGAACGECLRGKWECDGPDTVQCNDGGIVMNACGGCGMLEPARGDSCGSCGGEVVCDGAEATRCDARPNPCGGCGGLPNAPGSTCAGGTYSCDGLNSTRCTPATVNACGGNVTLSQAPGSACGDCGVGVVVCLSTNQTACVDDVSKNDCGGCNALALTVGSACGPNQVVACAGPDAVSCEDASIVNACGGMGALPDVPGSPCGPAGQCGAVVCDGPNSTTCGGLDTDPNDRLNCESCGTSCAMTETCQLGSCVTNQPTIPKWIDIELGTAHGCALTDTSEVFCWGKNDKGQLGTAASAAIPVPVKVSIGSPVIDIAASDDFSCAVNTAGQVLCWGEATHPELFDSTTSNSLATPTVVTGVEPGVEQIDAGWGTLCARTNLGRLQCWGENGATTAWGKAGNGDTSPAVRPGAVVQSLTNVNDFSVGQGHVCAVDGTTAYCWGNDGRFQLGDASQVSSSTPNQVIYPGGNFSKIVAGDQHACGLSGLEVVCWGYDAYSQAGGLNVPGNPKAVANVNGTTVIEASERTTFLGRSIELSSLGWGESGRLGNNRDGNSFGPGNKTHTKSVIDVAASITWGCSIDSNNIVDCWGTVPGGIPALLDGQKEPSAPRYDEVTSPYFENAAELCTDGIDNDQDGDIDCDDTDCFESVLTGTTGSVLPATPPPFDSNDGNYHDILSTCLPNSFAPGGIEKRFKWSAPAAGTYSVSSSPGASLFGIRYYVLDSCNETTNNQLACYTDDAFDMSWMISQQQFTATTAGQEFIFVVELPEGAYYPNSGMMTGDFSDYSLQVDTVP